MKAGRATISELNKVLGLELIAINQLFLHARILKNWGYASLAEHEYEASIQTMREADTLVERVLFLEGLPNLQDLGKLQIGQTVPEILAADLALESSLRAGLLAATAHCEQNSDFVSRELLSRIQKASEERIDFLEAQHDLLKGMGLQNYLQSAASAVGGSEE